MSIPISACLVAKAATGDDHAYSVLKERMNYNRRCPAFSVWPCEHGPRCEASEEQVEALNARMGVEFKAEDEEYQRLHPQNPNPYSKMIFPVIKDMDEIPALPDIRSIFDTDGPQT